MKRVLLLLVSGILFAQLLISESQAAQSQNGTSSTTARGSTLTHRAPNCADNGNYINSKGQTVKRPANCSSAPQGATAQCRDGTYSFSLSRRGTCSHHGGVAKWL